MAFKRWTLDEVAILRARYADESTEEIAADLGRGHRSVYRKAFELGIKKSEIFHAGPHSNRMKPGPDKRRKPFAEGHKPWNTGVKGLMLGPAWAKFQKGNKKADTSPLGAVGMRGGYQMVKVAHPDQWMLLHHHVWKEAGRELPQGHCLTFKDGDIFNVALENLEVKTRTQIILENSIVNYPPELRNTIQMIGALNRRLNSNGK